MEAEECLLRHKESQVSYLSRMRNNPMFEIKQTGRYWKEMNC